MLLVRKATQDDLERIADIKVRNWADTYGPLLEPATLAPFLDHGNQLAGLREVAVRPGALLLVAEDAEHGVIGFALTYLDHEPEPWLESLHVLREHRSRGAGEALMRETAVEMRHLGLRALRLGVVEGNSGAIRFYERLGAEFAGREPADWARNVWHEVYRWPDLESLTLPRR